jgi:hypothetical protein
MRQQRNRRAVDPSDGTAVGPKALLSIHRVYVQPLVAGRTRCSALISREVFRLKSTAPRCSPEPRISVVRQSGRRGSHPPGRSADDRPRGNAVAPLPAAG